MTHRRPLNPIAVRIAELEQLIVYWRKLGCPEAREQLEIEIAFWQARP